MRVIPKTHTVITLWEEYATGLLKNNYEYWSKRKNGSRIKVDVIYTKKMHRDGMVVVVVIDYKRFRRIVEQFFEMAKKEIIDGNAIRIPHCGKIAAKRVERDFRKGAKRMVNWEKTKERPKVMRNGKMMPDRLIYYTDPYWHRIGWSRPNVRNDSVYQFKPAEGNTRSDKGFKKEFTKALKDNPLSGYRYWFEPMRDYHTSRKPKPDGIQVDGNS